MEITFDGDGITSDCPLAGEVTILECLQCSYHEHFEGFSVECGISEEGLDTFL